MPRRRTAAALALALVLLADAAAFALLFAHDASDDYAGWIPAIAALGLPAALIILRDRDPLGHLGALTLAIPAGLALACVFASGAFVLPLGELLPVIILLVLGPLIALLLAFTLWRALHTQATRLAARRVLTLVAGAALVDLALLAPFWWGLWRLDPLAQGVAIAALLFAALPLLWAATPGVVLLVMGRADDPADTRSRSTRSSSGSA